MRPQILQKYKIRDLMFIHIEKLPQKGQRVQFLYSKTLYKECCWERDIWLERNFEVNGRLMQESLRLEFSDFQKLLLDAKVPELLVFWIVNFGKISSTVYRTEKIFCSLIFQDFEKKKWRLKANYLLILDFKQLCFSWIGGVFFSFLVGLWESILLSGQSRREFWC